MTGITAAGRATAEVRITAEVRFMGVGTYTGTTIGTTNTTAIIRRRIRDMFRIQRVIRIITEGGITVIAGGTTTGTRIIVTTMDRTTAGIVIVAVMRS
jgi:hypothetical protein